jgi:hypothetical protein
VWRLFVQGVLGWFGVVLPTQALLGWGTLFRGGSGILKSRFLALLGMKSFFGAGDPSTT